MFGFAAAQLWSPGTWPSDDSPVTRSGGIKSRLDNRKTHDELHAAHAVQQFIQARRSSFSDRDVIPALRADGEFC